MDTSQLDQELQFRAIRGSGPGGQHVNKVATKVEVRWKLTDTKAFSEAEIVRLSAKLHTRLNSDGELILTDHSTRSQHRNREKVLERFYQLLRRALHTPKKRKPTKPSQASRAKRLETKRRRSEVKSRRGPIDF